MKLFSLFVALSAVLFASARGAELQLLPSSARLDGPRAHQRFLVEDWESNAFVSDRTGEAVFSSDNPRVAAVAPDGTVTPVGNGSATIVATIGKDSARATVSVENVEKDEPWSFRNH